MSLYPNVTIAVIVAMDSKRIIGGSGAIPWHLPEDMKRLKALTTGHTAVMGRKTYESFPPKFRPLPNRRNIVITRNPSALDAPEEVERFTSISEWEKTLPNETGQIWIFGGGEIYKQTLHLWDEVHLTKVAGEHEGDTYFPEFESNFTLVEEDARQGYSFLTYRRS